MLTTIRNQASTPRLVGVFLLAFFSAIASAAQQGDNASVIQGIDASVNARDLGLAGYTVTEHYAVFRNQDQVHPAAEMMVKTTYQKDVGKSYAILSESGPSLLPLDRKSTRLNSSHANISYAVFCLKK